MTQQPPPMPPISAQVQAVRDELVALRRDFHAHPEPGYQEHRTAQTVARHLRESGLEVHTGVAQTGVVGLLEGARPGKTLMIRADMDALLLQEETGLPYASVNEGVMHACGHDGHMAMALTAARLLAAERDALAGQLKFVFQPAEEGPGGALPLIQAGVLEAPHVDMAIGLHVWNDTPVGQLGLTPGPMMGSADQFELTVTGLGGHAATPHETQDPIVAAAQIVTALQTIASRRVDPLQPMVITIGTIHGGTAFNVIPTTVTLQGTIRTYDQQLREELPREIERIASGIAESQQLQCHYRHLPLYPATANDPEMVKFVRNVLAGWLPGDDSIIGERTLGSEDMAYYLERVPGVFIFIGSRNEEKGLINPHHSSRFEFDEDALAIGLEVLLRTARAYLKQTAMPNSGGEVGLLGNRERRER